MKFPDFKGDHEMGSWFEENDIDPADLEPAGDVEISDDLTVVVIKEIFWMGPGGSSQASTAPTVDNGDRELTLAAK